MNRSVDARPAVPAPRVPRKLHPEIVAAQVDAAWVRAVKPDDSAIVSGDLLIPTRIRAAKTSPARHSRNPLGEPSIVNPDAISAASTPAKKAKLAAKAAAQLRNAHRRVSVARPQTETAVSDSSETPRVGMGLKELKKADIKDQVDQMWVEHEAENPGVDQAFVNPDAAFERLERGFRRSDAKAARQAEIALTIREQEELDEEYDVLETVILPFIRVEHAPAQLSVEDKEFLGNIPPAEDAKEVHLIARESDLKNIVQAPEMFRGEGSVDALVQMGKRGRAFLQRDLYANGAHIVDPENDGIEETGGAFLKYVYEEIPAANLVVVGETQTVFADKKPIKPSDPQNWLVEGFVGDRQTETRIDLRRAQDSLQGEAMAHPGSRPDALAQADELAEELTTSYGRAD